MVAARGIGVSRRSRWVLLLAVSLIAIRLVAAFFCATCFVDLEKPTTRSFHLHAGGDQDPCHHGRVEVAPVIQWACTVTQDEPAFILPEIPRLPLVAALSVPLLLPVISYRDVAPILATGRGPPHRSA